MKCPRCHSTNVKKNGTAERWRAGKKFRVQMYLCRNCGKQPVGDRVK